MIKDWRGNEIKIGSKIVWPGRSGSSMWMTEGEVVDIKIKKETNYQLQEIDVPTLYVKSSKATGFYYTQPKKLSVIKVIDRVTVIPESIPQKEATTPLTPFSSDEHLKVDPFDLPVVLGSDLQKDVQDKVPQIDYKTQIDIILNNLDADERRQLTRNLIKRSVNVLE